MCDTPDQAEIIINNNSNAESLGSGSRSFLFSLFRENDTRTCTFITCKFSVVLQVYTNPASHWNAPVIKTFWWWCYVPSVFNIHLWEIVRKVFTPHIFDRLCTWTRAICGFFTCLHPFVDHPSIAEIHSSFLLLRVQQYIPKGESQDCAASILSDPVCSYEWLYVGNTHVRVHVRIFERVPCREHPRGVHCEPCWIETPVGRYVRVCVYVRVRVRGFGCGWMPVCTYKSDFLQKLQR